jgi:oxygen-independent coproporphyrinogen-3 oxidase
VRPHRRCAAPLIVNAEHLYVHVPFCARRCVYCDFSIAVRSTVPVEEYLRAIERELSTRHRDSVFTLRSLYFGGGTPSKLGGHGVARLIDIVRGVAELREDAEVTLEANPEDVSAESVHAWRAAGINRVSLGVQSFDDATLGWMHRTHTAVDARNAVQVLREGGIDNLSIDLIFALPASLARSWQRDLDSALEFELPHLSVYGLTVEEQTPLGRWVARRDVSEAPEESFESEFLEAHEQLRAAGFDHYEVSNYARKNAHSRHNRAYWRRRAYAGLGPSAHEFDGHSRRWNAEAYAHWVTLLSAGSDPIAGSEQLNEEQAQAEEVYLRLRTSDGLIISTDERTQIERWIDAGWATIGSDSTLRLTGRGWLRLDHIASDLTMLRSRC